MAVDALIPMTPYDAVFSQAAADFNIPPFLFEALARTESSLRADLVTPESQGRHSYGLFQLLDDTVRALGFTGDFAELLDPATNTLWAAQLIKQNIERLGGLSAIDWRDFYSLYNSGRADLWRTSQEVRSHVDRFVTELQNATTSFVSHVTPEATGVVVAVLVVVATAAWLLRK